MHSSQSCIVCTLRADAAGRGSAARADGAARRSARFAEVERHLAEVIARRTGLDVDRDVYPALVVAATIGALKVGVTVWQERGRPGPLAELIDGAFDQLATGLALRAPAGATSRS